MKRTDQRTVYAHLANSDDSMKNKYLRMLARALPFFIIVVCLVGLLGSIIIGRYNFTICGLIIAVPAITAGIVLLHIYHYDLEFLSWSGFQFPFEQRTLTLLFGVIFSLVIVLGLICPVESLYFLSGIALLYTVILLQIFSRGYRPTVILIEIILAMACLIYETTLKYPYYFGSTDILPHVFMSTVTYVSGHVIPPDVSAGYAYFPLYHIWIALSSHVLALGIKPTLFLITCPVYVMVTVVLFYLFKRVTGNVQISLLACLLYSIDSTVTFYGAYMVTRAAAYIGFAILLYLIMTSNSGNNSDRRNRSFRALAILVTVYIVLIHQVSTPQILFLLLLLLGCEWFIGSEKHLQISFFIFEIILFLAYWIYVAFDFASYVGRSRLSPDLFDVPIVRDTLQSYSPLTFIFNNVDTLVFLFFAIIGIGYLLWKQKPAYAPVFGLFALLTIVLYVPTPIQTLWQTMRLLRFDRFMLLLSPFMAFIMGWGLYTMSGYLQKRISARAAGSIALLLFALYCCGATGIITAEDTPASRVSFTAEELNGLNHIRSYVPYGSIIYSDYYTFRSFGWSDVPGVPFYQGRIIRNVADIPPCQGFVIIPCKQFIEYGLRFSKGSETNPEGGTYPYLPSNETISTLSNSLTEKDKIYSSEFIELYHS